MATCEGRPVGMREMILFSALWSRFSCIQTIAAPLWVTRNTLVYSVHPLNSLLPAIVGLLFCFFVVTEADSVELVLQGECWLNRLEAASQLLGRVLASDLVFLHVGKSVTKGRWNPESFNGNNFLSFPTLNMQQDSWNSGNNVSMVDRRQVGGVSGNLTLSSTPTPRNVAAGLVASPLHPKCPSNPNVEQNAEDFRVESPESSQQTVTLFHRTSQPFFNKLTKWSSELSFEGEMAETKALCVTALGRFRLYCYQHVIPQSNWFPRDPSYVAANKHMKQEGRRHRNQHLGGNTGSFCSTKNMNVKVL